MGQEKETATRICHELPGYNWLEEKIRKSVSSNDPPPTTPTPSLTSSAVSNVDDSCGGSQSKPSNLSTDMIGTQE